MVVDEIKRKRLECNMVCLWGKQEALGEMVHYTTIRKGLKIQFGRPIRVDHTGGVLCKINRNVLKNASRCRLARSDGKMRDGHKDYVWMFGQRGRKK